MTLRCTLEIIPFGDEEKKRVIRTLNISNVSFTEETPDGYNIYVIEVDDYKNYNDKTPRVLHKREDGAEELVRKSLETLRLKKILTR